MPFYKNFKINAETELAFGKLPKEPNFIETSILTQHSLDRLNGMKIRKPSCCSDKTYHIQLF
jgi:hypothetical protein